MTAAQLTAPLATTGNYSYTARRTAGDRFLMIGDAFAFIDPIFSSGVMIAMTTGVLGAEAVDAFLADERRGQRALRRIERQVRRATAQLSWIIYRINDPVLRYLLMHPSNRFPHTRRAALGAGRRDLRQQPGDAPQGAGLPRRLLHPEDAHPRRAAGNRDAASDIRFLRIRSSAATSALGFSKPAFGGACDVYLADTAAALLPACAALSASR